jgi:hypothetical protein
MLIHTEDSSLLGYDAVSVGKQSVLGESAASLLGLSGPEEMKMEAACSSEW